MFNGIAGALALTLISNWAGAADLPRGSVGATVGAIYDSNILVATDTIFDQGVPSRLADYRALTAGEAAYDVYRSGRHHFGGLAEASLVNTARAARAAGDTYLFSAGVPYVFDFASLRSYRVLVRPTFRRLLMDPALTSQKLNVLNSQLIAIEQTYRWSAYFDTSAELEYRRDDFALRSSVGPDDADANKISAAAFETYRPRASVAHFWRGGVRYVSNQARGVNARYGRAEVNLRYVRPFVGSSSLQLEASAFRLDFARTASSRREFNVGGVARVMVPLTDAFTLEVEGRYARNAGRTPLFTYDRFAVMTALAMTTAF